AQAGAGLLLGVSCYNDLRRADALLAAGADRPAVVAIGGITPANVSQVAQAGADSAAVISGLFEAPDIQAAARACAAAFSVNP
ncbi:thiamine phosphate synthase, partial [Bordetella pertussis]|uniref:thiamine phosphate synthase n=1 Tax=Bordetella pertussis TaxID=520 RepID=UPI000AA62B4A